MKYPVDTNQLQRYSIRVVVYLTVLLPTFMTGASSLAYDENHKRGMATMSKQSKSNIFSPHTGKSSGSHFMKGPLPDKVPSDYVIDEIDGIVCLLPSRTVPPSLAKQKNNDKKMKSKDKKMKSKYKKMSGKGKEKGKTQPSESTADLPLCPRPSVPAERNTASPAPTLEYTAVYDGLGSDHPTSFSDDGALDETVQPTIDVSGVSSDWPTGLPGGDIGIDSHEPIGSPSTIIIAPPSSLEIYPTTKIPSSLAKPTKSDVGGKYSLAPSDVTSSPIGAELNVTDGSSNSTSNATNAVGGATGNSITGIQNQIGSTENNRMSAAAGVSLAAGGLFLLLLLIFLVRFGKPKRTDSMMKHQQLNNLDEEYYLQDIDTVQSHQPRLHRSGSNRQNENAHQTHQARVVGDEDSIISLWTSHSMFKPTVDSGSIMAPLREDPTNSGLATRQDHHDVHKCNSALCDLCERQRRDHSLQFVSCRMPSHSHASLPPDAFRDYESDNTVQL